VFRAPPSNRRGPRQVVPHLVDAGEADLPEEEVAPRAPPASGARARRPHLTTLPRSPPPPHRANTNVKIEVTIAITESKEQAQVPTVPYKI